MLHSKQVALNWGNCKQVVLYWGNCKQMVLYWGNCKQVALYWGNCKKKKNISTNPEQSIPKESWTQLVSTNVILDFIIVWHCPQFYIYRLAQDWTISSVTAMDISQWYAKPLEDTTKNSKEIQLSYSQHENINSLWPGDAICHFIDLGQHWFR